MTKYPIPLRGIAVKSAGAALNYLAGGGYAPYETGIIVTAAALKMSRRDANRECLCQPTRRQWA